MKTLDPKENNRQNFIFSLLTNKLETCDINSKKEMLQYFKYTNNIYIKTKYKENTCPFGCNEKEDVIHFMKCSKNPHKIRNLQYKINKITMKKSDLTSEEIIQYITSFDYTILTKNKYRIPKINKRILNSTINYLYKRWTIRGKTLHKKTLQILKTNSTRS